MHTPSGLPEMFYRWQQPDFSICPLQMLHLSYENLQILSHRLVAFHQFCIFQKPVQIPVFPLQIGHKYFLGFFDTDLFPVKHDIHDGFFHIIDLEFIPAFLDRSNTQLVPVIFSIPIPFDLFSAFFVSVGFQLNDAVKRIVCQSKYERLLYCFSSEST